MILNSKFDNPFQERIFDKNRDSLFKELCRIPKFIQAVNSLKKQSLYRLVSKPECGKFNDMAELQVVFYKDGKIVKNLRLESVKPSFFKAFQAIGSQILLVSISMQLTQIERKIDRVFHDLHNDRLGEIKSGLEQFDQAKLINDSDIQKSMIVHAVQTLNSGIEKTIKSLKFQIEDAPSKLSFLDNWGLKSKTDEADEKFGLAEESFKASLSGISALSECFSVLNEPEAAAKTLSSNLARLYLCDIRSAAKKARLVPYTGKLLPEKPWLDFLESRSTIDNKIEECRNIAVKGLFEFEFTRSELEGGLL